MMVKNIMIIGAAGSLGSVLCKILLDDGYNIFAVDLNENNLAYLHRLYDVSTYIEDLQNTNRLVKIIERESIELVINCAALKHVRWCENNIRHAIDINIISNLNLMEYLAAKNKEFIYISSDKAIEPTNLYALTKQFTDYIVHHYDFKLVRGVNFFNSRGSVIDIWETQRREGGTFTVTRDNCERYFILISQMAESVKEAIEDTSEKREFYPNKVYGINIEDLFMAFLRFRDMKIEDVKIKRFSIPPNEKLREVLDFEPEIIEADSIEKIIELFEKSKNIFR